MKTSNNNYTYFEKDFDKFISEIERELVKDSLDKEHFNTAKEEAKWGLFVISPYLNPGQKILEIGSGTTLLSAFLAYKGFYITAIEPIGIGFCKNKEIISRILKINIPNLHFFDGRVENFQSSSKFDLIFSINVFEHLPSVSLGVSKISSLLTKSGQAIIACPNYNVPYESHFGIPILFNKKLTHLIFKNYISTFEKKYDCNGLWKSLNFLKSQQMKKLCSDENMLVSYDKGILVSIFKRAFCDEKFIERHKILAPIVKFIMFLKLDKLIQKLPHYLSPYVLAKVTHKNTTEN